MEKNEYSVICPNCKFPFSIESALEQKLSDKMSKWDCFSKLRMKDVFNEILKDSPVSVKFIRGSWLDINSIMDLQKSESFIYD